MLESIAKATLQNTYNWLSLGPPEYSSYERYFLKTNMEKLVPQFADKIFWKVLIILSKGIFSFG